ncbi:MAG TPA: hypothetical protein VMG82_39890 [Candidatus Sulfotelmatobacter sp.]|nr:hypothetical protein [Candidatus Sulfotelmatobacter sp.]
MLAFRYLLMSGGFAMILVAASILGYDLYTANLDRKTLATPGAVAALLAKRRWRASVALALLAWGPILLLLGLVLVPSGTAGVHVSSISGNVDHCIDARQT